MHTEDNAKIVMEVIYSRESDLKKPITMLCSMLKDIFRSRELAWRLFVRNTSALYRQSFLGYIWTILPPIAVTLIFLFLQRSRIINVEDTGVPYEVYVLSGVVLWQLYYDAVFSPLKIVGDSKAMLAKTNFPREALIMAGVYDVLLNSIIRFSLLLLVMVFYGITPAVSMLYVPLGIISILVFGLMCGLLLTPISLLYDDIQKALALAMSMLFLLTPVVYPPTLLNENSVALLLNPIATLLLTTRSWLINTMDINHLSIFFAITVTSFLALMICWVLYRVALPHLICRIGS